MPVEWDAEKRTKMSCQVNEWLNEVSLPANEFNHDDDKGNSGTGDSAQTGSGANYCVEASVNTGMAGLTEAMVEEWVRHLRHHNLLHHYPHQTTQDGSHLGRYNSQLAESQ